jgi:hypothetical protein
VKRQLKSACTTRTNSHIISQRGKTANQKDYTTRLNETLNKKRILEENQLN